MRPPARSSFSWIALAVFLVRRCRKERRDVVAHVRRDALEPADRDGLAVDAGAPACRLAWTVARASQDARKNVRLAVEEIRLGVFPLRDQPDVLGHVRVCRARVLAVDDFMVVAGVRDVCGAHAEWMIAAGGDGCKYS
jgi:hypothetical protein